MGEQKLFQVPSDWLKSAVEVLRSAGVEVVAPVEEEKGVINLAPVASAEEIAPRYVNVLLPLKRLFLPPSEVLIEYEKGENGDVDVRSQSFSDDGEMVVMGCRPCDAAALEALDKVFQWDYDDVRYRARRERATIVSFACTEPDARCFCTSLNGSPHGTEGSDVVVFFRRDGDFLMQVVSEKGKKFIERLSNVVRPAPDGAELPPAPELLPGMLESASGNRIKPVWILVKANNIKLCICLRTIQIIY